MLSRSAVHRAGRVGRWLNEVVLCRAQRAVDYDLAYTIDFIGIYGFDGGQGGRKPPKKTLASFRGEGRGNVSRHLRGGGREGRGGGHIDATLSS